MDDTRHPRSRVTPHGDYHHDDDFNGSFGCFGLRLRSTSPSRHNSRDRMPRPRYDATHLGDVLDPYDPSVSELRGFPIKGKSAEILGFMPKSAPITPPKSRTSSPVPWRSISDATYPRSHKEHSLASANSSISLRRDTEPPMIDPLITVRRRLKEQAANPSSSKYRSSSAPAPPSRNYSRKWRKSMRIATTPPLDYPLHHNKDFFDATSRDNSIEEEEIPDTNKFDTLPKTNSHSEDRIKSAAFTTFAWMQLQGEGTNSAGGTLGRGSWLLDTPSSAAAVTRNTANESRKRIQLDEDFVKSDDKRDTLEWMGVRPGDFPTPVVAV